MSSDPVLSAHEVADEIGVTYATVCGYLRTGELKGVKHGQRWFIRKSWLEEFLTPADEHDVA